jgi:hypothetical protein
METLGWAGLWSIAAKSWAFMKNLFDFRARDELIEANKELQADSAALKRLRNVEELKRQCTHRDNAYVDNTTGAVYCVNCLEDGEKRSLLRKTKFCSTAYCPHCKTHASDVFPVPEEPTYRRDEVEPYDDGSGVII